MGIASVIIGAAGWVFSFILGFPLSYIFGPYIGIVFGVVGFVLGAVGQKKKPGKATVWGMIICGALIGVGIIRILSFASCVGKVASGIGSLLEIKA